jgi:hypothetical protein
MDQVEQSQIRFPKPSSSLEQEGCHLKHPVCFDRTMRVRAGGIAIYSLASRSASTAQGNRLEDGQFMKPYPDPTA